MPSGFVTRFLALFFTIFLLNACGGSSSSTPPPAATETITGTAAKGAAIVGSVTAIDVKGTLSSSVTIGADGSFEVVVTGLSGPFMLKAEAGNGSDPTLYSYAEAAGSVANITPLTHLAM